MRGGREGDLAWRSEDEERRSVLHGQCFTYSVHVFYIVLEREWVTDVEDFVPRSALQSWWVCDANRFVTSTYEILPVT